MSVNLESEDHQQNSGHPLSNWPEDKLVRLDNMLAKYDAANQMGRWVFNSVLFLSAFAGGLFYVWGLLHGAEHPTSTGR